MRLSGNAADIEMRMKQGFSVFVMNWGDAGFKAVEAGRKAAGRDDDGSLTEGRGLKPHAIAALKGAPL